MHPLQDDDYCGIKIEALIIFIQDEFSLLFLDLGSLCCRGIHQLIHRVI